MRRRNGAGAFAAAAAAATLLTALIPSTRANAQVVWNEVGDAGALPGAAQITAGTGGLPLLSISGSLNSTTDVDMYRIFLTGGGTFSATTVDQDGELFDSQLYLFDANGFGIYANDDDPFSLGARSTLPAFDPLTPLRAGFYYIAISAAPRRPTSAGGLIFPAEPYTDVAGPTGPGGGSAVTGWTGTASESGVSYKIAFVGAQAAVPEPGTLILVAVAGAPVALLVRRRRRRG